MLWMAIHGRLQTQDRLFQWNNDISMKCALCKKCMDSHTHLFIQCNYTVEVWNSIRKKGYLEGLRQNWEETVNNMAINQSNAIKSVVCRIVFSVVVYYIWQERNKRQFANEVRPAQVLVDIIMESVKTRLSGLTVKESMNVQRVAKDWGIKFKSLTMGKSSCNLEFVWYDCTYLYFHSLSDWPWDESDRLCLGQWNRESVKDEPSWSTQCTVKGGLDGSS
ncbi:reverse transcriptase domain, reverse transcriptase zinc-binding domain protein [Tanacetum coccineum]